MSWMPNNDPILGDPQSCDALELVVVPRTRDLGDGFAVRRALPHGKRQMVGPFIFFDHFGPVQFVAGKGMDVRPHPHIGLATVTYLFDGSIEPRTFCRTGRIEITLYFEEFERPARMLVPNSLGKPRDHPIQRMSKSDSDGSGLDRLRG